MFNCVYHSHLPPPCLSKLRTQSSPFLFIAPLWSQCRSRSLSLMLSVNEAALHCATKRRHGLQTAPEALFFFCFFCSRALPFYRPVTENSRPTLAFDFLGQRRKEGGCTGRHCQEVACLFTVISASAARSYSLIYTTYLTAL